MLHYQDIAGSIERIWVIWAASLVALGWLTIRLLHRVRWPHLRGIALDEDGAAYTLSYVMVIPLYVLFMCLVVETTLVILAKFGTNYASYAAVRSAIVHYTNKDLPTAESWAQRAAVKAFVPFANGVEELGSTVSADPEVDAYWQAYREYATKPASERYIRAKYAYARKHLAADLELEPVGEQSKDEPWLADMTVKVRYRYSFHVPIVGRLLGQTDSQGTYYMVHSAATLQSEAPKNEQQALGIDYEPWRQTTL